MGFGGLNKLTRALFADRKILTHGSSTNAQEDDSIEFWGDPDQFLLLQKAASQENGWSVSTKAMQIDGVGCVVNTSRFHKGAIAEALVFVPGVKIAEIPGGGRKLVPIDARPTGEGIGYSAGYS